MRSSESANKPSQAISVRIKCRFGRSQIAAKAVSQKANSSEIRACYQHELEHSPTLAGKLLVRFTIDTKAGEQEVSRDMVFYWWPLD